MTQYRYFINTTHLALSVLTTIFFNIALHTRYLTHNDRKNKNFKRFSFETKQKHT